MKLKYYPTGAEEPQEIERTKDVTVDEDGRKFAGPRGGVYLRDGNNPENHNPSYKMIGTLTKPAKRSDYVSKKRARI